MIPAERMSIQKERDINRNRFKFILCQISPYYKELHFDSLKFPYDNENYEIFVDIPNKFALPEHENFDQLAHSILERVYRKDDPELTRKAITYLFFHTPKYLGEIENILVKGINDKNKSVKLRVEFLFLYERYFENKAKDFYLNKLSDFFEENFDNVELNGNIIDNITISLLYFSKEEMDIIKKSVKGYLAKKPEVKKFIILDDAKKVFEIE